MSDCSDCKTLINQLNIIEEFYSSNSDLYDRCYDEIMKLRRESRLRYFKETTDCYERPHKCNCYDFIQPLICKLDELFTFVSINEFALAKYINDFKINKGI